MDLKLACSKIRGEMLFLVGWDWVRPQLCLLKKDMGLALGFLFPSQKEV